MDPEEGVDVFVTYYIVLLVPVTGLLQNNQKFGEIHSDSPTIVQENWSTPVGTME